MMYAVGTCVEKQRTDHLILNRETTWYYEVGYSFHNSVTVFNPQYYAICFNNLLMIDIILSSSYFCYT